MAAVIGLVVPGVVLVVGRRDRAVRRALAPSLIALGVQAGLERSFVGAPSRARAVGAAGTVARLALLAHAWRGPRRQLGATTARPVSAVLAVNLGFWTANLVVLARGRLDGRTALA